jgi:hypothetical protein
MTFRACSSLAPTPVKPQPAPAILHQESVHTTLSITHHTRKRPSTDPRTTHGPQNMTPRSPGTKREKMTNSEDLARKVPNLARQGASSNSERNRRHGPTCRRGKDLEDSGTNAGQRRRLTGPKWAQAGRPRPADPAHSEAQSPLSDLAAIRAIYSPEAESHTSIHSSSAAEEQRREGHHLGEERVELVD